MAITVEVSGDVRIADTTGGASRILASLAKSISVTEKCDQLISIANNTTDFTLTFGGVSAAKILFVQTDVAVSIKPSGTSTAVPVLTEYLSIDTAGGITSCTISNSSGNTASVSYFVAG